MSLSAEDCTRGPGETALSPCIRDPWETDFAAIVPRITGGLSAISSALIIYVILRSHTKLSTIYHRIMFGMAVADVIGSFSIALTTLPMPKYMPREEEFGYHWAGTRLGNTQTCNAQGFFATFGLISMFEYNVMLCVYYACAIAFKMREKNIRRYVEPVLHSIPIAIGLGCAVPSLFFEMYNPAVSDAAWCGAIPYPAECRMPDVECIRGTRDLAEFASVLISVLILLDFVVIIISLFWTVWTVIQTDAILTRLTSEHERRADESSSNSNSNSGLERVMTNHKNTKVILVQALAYIAAFTLSLISPLIIGTGAVADEGLQVEARFDKIMLVTLPMQGFFNFCIFTSHKVYNYRRANQDASICHVLNRLFCSSVDEPYFISRITMVEAHANAPNANGDIGDNACHDDKVMGKIKIEVQDEGSSWSMSFFMSRSDFEPESQCSIGDLSYPSHAMISTGDVENDASSAIHMYGQGIIALDQSGDSFDDNADISHARSRGELSSDSKISSFSKAGSAAI